MSHFRYLFYIMITVQPCITYATLEKTTKNTIYHTSQELKLPRTVVFSGHSLIPNLIPYSDRAIMTKKASIQKDISCDIDIVYAEVIKFYAATHPPYNAMIAYIVKTSGGKWYIKYQMPVLTKKVAAPISMKEKFVPRSGSFDISEGRVFSSEGATPFVIVSGEQTDVNEYVKGLPADFSIDSEMRYVWATVLLEPQSKIWNQDFQKLDLADLCCKYDVIEFKRFD